MELKDYIADTIEQISLGILEASERCGQYGVIVNPNVTTGSSGDYCIPKNPERVNIQRRVQLLDMDIAVTAIESEEGKIGGKLGVSFMGIHGDAAGGKSTSNENRIKFSIPVCLPVTNILTE